MYFINLYITKLHFGLPHALHIVIYTSNDTALKKLVFNLWHLYYSFEN